MPKVKRFKWFEWAYYSQTLFINDEPRVVAVDTETSGLAFHDQPFCVTMSWRGPGGEMRSAYFDTDHGAEWPVPLGDEDGGVEQRKRIVKDLLSRADVLVFHNAKFDLQKLELAGMLPDDKHGYSIEDTQTIFNLINENERKALKLLAQSILGESTNEDEKLKKVRKKLGLKKEDGYYHLPREVIIPYAMKDTEFTLRLYETLRPKLDTMIELDPPLATVYAEEIEVSEVLREMEAIGFTLDMPYLTTTTEEYEVRVMEGWQSIVKLVEDEEFNPNSPAQIKAAFGKRDIELPDTQAKTLQSVDDDLARLLLQYRSDTKIHSTYLKALLNEQVDGVVHPWFNPTGARTGRMSSGSANA